MNTKSISLRDVKLKSVYRSSTDSILSDFYLPALKTAASYDRAVGFFSSAILTYAAQGISALIKNGGTMRLIVGAVLDPEDFEAVKAGHDLQAHLEKLALDSIIVLDEITDELAAHRLELLSWMVATGALKIKFAIRRKGMYHEKMGIIYDSNGESIVFQGSANESVYALVPDFNYESITVYRSWTPEIFNEYAKEFVDGFEILWENRDTDTVVVDIPSILYDKIVEIRPPGNLPDTEIEKDIFEQTFMRDSSDLHPKVPAVLFGQKFELKRHQKLALESWKANDFTGIFSLATGAGKTITAIYGAIRLWESTKRLFIVIAVPYQNLGDQWAEVLRLFGIEPIKCYKNRSDWFDALQQEIRNFNYGGPAFSCVVVVNATLCSDGFQSTFNQLSESSLKACLFIGDECHHHNSESFKAKLPNVRTRLGLSATPLPYNDPVAGKALLDYYGPIVSEYSIDDAMHDKVLTPYKYYIHPIYLTEDETEEYLVISAKLAPLLAAMQEGKPINREILTALMLKRSRLLGSASDKLVVLENLLNKTQISAHTLFYCGDGYVDDEDDGTRNRQIELVSRMLGEHSWKSSRFTAEESLSDRRRILNGFKSAFIQALVAIKVLDEGIDIPACRTAYLLASSRNPRQFIQRRGRILRKSSGKTFAEIHDFIVLPNGNAPIVSSTRELVSREIERAVEFVRLCMNQSEVHAVLDPLARSFDLIDVTTYKTLDKGLDDE